MAKKVFLGVGHGGSDPGAVKYAVEKDLNLSIALYGKDVLVRHGVEVLMSRTKDENDTLPEEIRECNEYNPDLAVDLHNNAGGGDGAEAYYHYKGGVSKTLAINILAEIERIGQNSRGAKIKKNASGDDYFGFIRETRCPAVIVECAFVDNAKDMQILDTEAKCKTMGEAVAKGILKTLCIAYTEEKKETQKAETSPSVLEWQKAAIADGFKFPKYGADGMWGAECESVAKNALVMRRNIYMYKNLTKIVQKVVGVEADGLCGIATDYAIKAYQKKHGLTVDGCVGINTWKKILGV